MSSTMRLVEALRAKAAHNRDPRLTTMISLAEGGHYHDFKSPLIFPEMQLIQDLTVLGLTDLAERAKNGEFDATPEESAEWAKSPEGIAAINELCGIGQPPPRTGGRSKKPRPESNRH